MKRICKSLTFWFILISILVICMHQIGQDSKSIMLIGFNPLLNMISSSNGALNQFMQSGALIDCNTIVGNISIYWYIGSVITLMMYGLCLDGMKWGFKKIANYTK